jgi:Glycosyl hydrolase-like 10
MPKTTPAPQRAPRYRIILCNDGATLAAPNREAPIGIEGFVSGTIGPLRNTTINTLYWQLGTDPYKGTPTHRLSDWYSHSTRVGAIWGSGRDTFKTAGEWRIYKNAQTLAEQGQDSVAVVIEHGHRAGLDVFVSMRINDGSDCRLPGGLDDVNMSPVRRNHPEWLLWEDAFIHPSVTARQRDHSRFAFNFLLPEVRGYTFALIKEAIDNYDLDGFDLDFCRQPSLFKASEAGSAEAVIIDLLKQIRSALNVKSSQVGRKLFLSMRVPPDLEANRRAGLDVAAWIKMGLADIVIVGDPRGWNYRLPIEEYLALAEGYDCKIVAQNLCAFREDRGQSAAVLFGDYGGYSPEQYRAVAARHWRAGAQGQYIWNQHFIKFIIDDKYDGTTWREIGDPQKLARLNKHYLTGPVGQGGPLPIKLATDVEANVDVEVADNFECENSPQAILRFMIEQLTHLDELRMQFNGVTLDRATACERLNYNDCWLDFDVSHVIENGNNKFSVKVITRNSHVEASLILKSVEVLVTYRP